MHGFNTFVLKHKHRDIGFYLYNDCLRWENWKINWFRLFCVCVNTEWRKHIFGDIIVICDMNNFIFLDIFVFIYTLLCSFTFYIKIFLGHFKWNKTKIEMIYICIFGKNQT